MWKSLLISLFALSLAGCCTSPSPQQKTVTFGIMADIQYADKKPNGSRNYYTLERLGAAVEELNRLDLAFTIQLGDIIDGNTTHEQTLLELDRVLEGYRQLTMPAFHVVGNHCISAGKEELKERLNLPRFYYDFQTPEAPGWRFIVLDSNDGGYGAIGKKQLKWLRKRLAKAKRAAQNVIVFSHYPLLHEAAPNGSLNHPEAALKILEESGCVVALFSGHDHAGGYAFRNGIHHITLKGMLEAPESNAFATITLSKEKLIENGFGKEPDRKLAFGLPNPQTTP